MIDHCGTDYSQSQPLLNKSGVLCWTIMICNDLGVTILMMDEAPVKGGVTRSRGEKKSSPRRILTLLTAGCNCPQIQVFIIIK